jgi:putative transposase
LVEYYVLFFIDIGSRRVIVTGMTPNPDAGWVAQQSCDFILLTDKQPKPPAYLVRDFDAKFTKEFDAILKTANIEPIKVGPAAPNLSPHAERFVLSIKSECLDDFVVFGEAHLQYLVKEYLDHYNTERAHQGVGNIPLSSPAGDLPKEGRQVYLPCTARRPLEAL